MDNKKNYEFLMESLKTEQMTRNTGMELGLLESYGHIGCISRVLRCLFFLDHRMYHPEIKHGDGHSTT